ncbi:MAG: 50S ribosomal protein L25/general stress protein Ctc [Gammaproteobacteria bacterium]
MSSVGFTLNAEPRSEQGKGANRRLRHAGKVPGVLYGAGKDPMPIMLDHQKLMHDLAREAFYSHILTVNVNGTSERAILRDLQRHPSKPRILHVDLQRVSEDKEIRVNVPIHFIGEDVAVGVKQQGGVVSHLLSEIEISCLPKDLPEFIEADITKLELNESLHLSDLKVAQGVTIVELSYGEERDHAVVNIHVPRAIEIEAPEEGLEEGAVPEGEADEEGKEAGEESKEAGEAS